MSPNRANVSVEFRNSPFKAQKVVPLTMRLVHYPSQTIERINSGTSIPLNFSDVGGTFQISTPSPADVPSYRISYEVTGRRPLRRIPLSVPDMPIDCSREPVAIEVVLPTDYVSVGSTFPMLQWKDTTHAEAHLNAIPSVLLLQAKKASDVTFTDRWLDTSKLSTIFMFSFLLVASLIWYMRSR